MQALLVFSPENCHPFAFLLNKQRRHVFVCLCTENAWVMYDWRMGLPKIESVAAVGFDLPSFYRDDGFEVLEIETGEHIGYGPFMMNNCVGHAKMVIGCGSYALVPNGLYKHFTRGSAMKKFFSYVKMLTVVPGFGGGSSPAPPPPPPPPEPVAKKADKDVQTARREEMKLARIKAGQAGTNVTGGALDTSTATTTKTMLG